MREYEIVVVLNPALGQTDATTQWDRIKTGVTTAGGEIFDEQHWGMRRLAYPISRPGHRFIEGNYYLARFRSESKTPGTVDRNLRISEAVLRHLIVNYVPVPPSRQLQAQAPVAAAAGVAAAPAAAPAAPVAAQPVAAQPAAEPPEPKVESEVQQPPAAETSAPSAS